MIEPSIRQQILERRRDLERLASCNSSLARTVCSTCGQAGTGSSGVGVGVRWAGDARAGGGGVQAACRVLDRGGDGIDLLRLASHQPAEVDEDLVDLAHCRLPGGKGAPRGGQEQVVVAVVWAPADLDLLDRTLALDDVLLRGARHLRKRGGANARSEKLSPSAI